MPDSEPKSPAITREHAETYRTDGASATHSSDECIAEEIARLGPMPFARFMEIALYHPEHGYYARGAGQVGRSGDFYTSVSVGPLFGTLLARRFLAYWQDAGSPTQWRIIECGAHDGSLARDILTALRKLSPPAFQAVEYRIPEPLPALLAAQQTQLAGLPVSHVADIGRLADCPLPGIAFGNELLDALPCHLVEWNGEAWRELRVATVADSTFAFVPLEPSSPKLLTALDRLPTNLPTGYRTELRTSYADFLTPLVDALDHGLMLWIDYGFARHDYYHPARATGTLRTFRHHQADEDPLETPGLRDITAHVDFTSLAEAVASLGGEITEFTTQGRWLTELARPWLLAMEGRLDPHAIRQFQSLTHPAHLGRSFHVLEATWQSSKETPDVLHARLFAPPVME